MIQAIMLKIRRRETPFWGSVYSLLKNVKSLSIPASPLHRALYVERSARRTFFRGVAAAIYYEPMFRTRCDSCGNRLQLVGGMPLILGHLRLHLGDNVTMHGYATFSGGKQFDFPSLFVGDNSYLGYGVTIAVGEKVSIGSNVLVANGVTILADDLHPLDPVRRRAGRPSEPEQVQPVHIGDDVWIGEGAKILKGVSIGEASVVGVGAIVTQDVPAYAIVAGNPARVIGKVNHEK